MTKKIIKNETPFDISFCVPLLPNQSMATDI